MIEFEPSMAPAPTMGRKLGARICPLCRQPAAISGTGAPTSTRLCGRCQDTVQIILARPLTPSTQQSAMSSPAQKPAVETIDPPVQFEWMTSHELDSEVSIQPEAAPDSFVAEADVQDLPHSPAKELSQPVSQGGPDDSEIGSPQPIVYQGESRPSRSRKPLWISIGLLAVLTAAVVMFRADLPWFGATEVASGEVATPETGGSQATSKPAGTDPGRTEQPAAATGARASDSEGDAGAVTLQAASFPNEPAAREFAERLLKHGIPAYVLRAEIARRGQWFRVRVGRFKDRSEATKFAEQSRQLGRAAGVNLDLVVCNYEEP